MSPFTLPIAMISFLAALLAGCGLGDSGGGGADQGPIDPGGSPVLLIPPVSCATPTIIKDSITTSTSLASGCYLVTGLVTIAKDARLEIKPQSIVLFDAGAGLFVEGELVATGTPTQAIQFTGKTKSAGFWSAIIFPSSSAGNSRLDNVIVEYGGGGRFNSRTEYANIWVQAGNINTPPTRTLSITNSNITEGSASGIYIGANSRLKTFSRNLIQKNASTPAATNYAGVTLDASELHLIDANNVISNNAVQDILITGSHMPAAPPPGVTAPDTFVWHAFPAPYTVEAPLSISRNLNIEAGTKFVFTRGTSFTIEGNRAVVRMMGSADRPITFTGQAQEPGYWKGMTIEVGHNTSSPGVGTSIELNHVIIEYGGGGQPSANLSLKNTLNSDATHNSISIIDSTLRFSGGTANSPNDHIGYGLYMDGTVKVDRFVGNKFTGNKYPVRVNHLSVPQLEAEANVDNDYRGNTVDEVIIEKPGGTTAFLVGAAGETFAWPALNVPYHILNTLRVQSPLTLAAGLTLRFDPEKSLEVEAKGVLIAEGTATKPVTITNAAGTATPTTFWKGIFFYQGGTATIPNKLNYVVVENANNNITDLLKGISVSAMVQIPATAEKYRAFVDITNSTFRGGLGYGVYAGKFSTVKSTNNIFEGVQSIYTQ